jgi:hypothetical protein
MCVKFTAICAHWGASPTVTFIIYLILFKVKFTNGLEYINGQSELFDVQNILHNMYKSYIKLKKQS